MEKLIKIIEHIFDTTGMSIVDNIFSPGQCTVFNIEGQPVYSGDRISCQLYVHHRYKEILNEKTVESSDDRNGT